ncbi:hypothetical protein EJV44_24775, partial [Ancylobacter aquaticus]
MDTEPIRNVDHIFDTIFHAETSDENIMKNFDTVDNLVLKNSKTGVTKVVESNSNFKKLLELMSDKNTQCKLDYCQDSVSVDPHDWYVKGNYFMVTVKPFVNKKHYEIIKNKVDFSKFVRCVGDNEYANKCVKSKDYYYWPNIDVSYFGWRQYIFMNFGIDIGDYIPLIHNHKLGNVNLFVFNAEFFLNVEMSLHIEGRGFLFVNGNSDFVEENDDLFKIITADGTVGYCKVLPVLVFSDKKLFDVIREDITLRQC